MTKQTKGTIGYLSNIGVSLFYVSCYRCILWWCLSEAIAGKAADRFGEKVHALKLTSQKLDYEDVLKLQRLLILLTLIIIHFITFSFNRVLFFCSLKFNEWVNQLPEYQKKRNHQKEGRL